MLVNICGRVSASFTGRPTNLAACTVRMVCGQHEPLQPKPPPRYFVTTRTCSVARPSMVLSAFWVRVTPWVDSYTVRRSGASQWAVVAPGSIGLWWLVAWVYLWVSWMGAAAKAAWALPRTT